MANPSIHELITQPFTDHGCVNRSHLHYLAVAAVTAQELHVGLIYEVQKPYSFGSAII
jgi:hypothetical protein